MDSFKEQVHRLNKIVIDAAKKGENVASRVSLELQSGVKKNKHIIAGLVVAALVFVYLFYTQPDFVMLKQGLDSKLDYVKAVLLSLIVGLSAMLVIRYLL